MASEGAAVWCMVIAVAQSGRRAIAGTREVFRETKNELAEKDMVGKGEGLCHPPSDDLDDGWPAH